jgi:dTDP-4-dehydrorhamnose 3,5-epimerase
MAGISVSPFDVHGLLLLTPARFADARGYFSETFHAEEFARAGVDAAFVQDNQSYSTRLGTIRGLHFQTPPQAQAKLVRVVVGSIFDVAVDLRRGSATYAEWRGVTLSAESGNQLYVPSGFAHGFCTLEPHTVVAYKVDRYYAPECDSGLLWNDPDLAIKWPVLPAEAVLSEKDARLPRLADFASPFSM